MARLSPDQQEEVLALLAARVPVREICRRYHCHHDVVDRLRPVPLRQRVRPEMTTGEAMAVAIQYGTSLATVEHMRKDAGHRFRGRSERWKPSVRSVSTVLGQNLRRERLRHNLTLQQLAERSGTSAGYLCAMEKRPSRPAAETVYRLARALGLSMEALLGGSEEPALVISEALWLAARQYPIPPEDVEMLARIRQQGRQPSTPAGWWQLYRGLLLLLDQGW